MKVCDFTFRDLDRKWVGISSKKYCKKIAKKIKEKKLKPPIFGYFYIDKDDGINLRIVGNLEKDGRNKLYASLDFILDKECIVDYEFVEKCEIEVLPDEVVNNIDGTNVLENKLESNYKDINKFLSTRDMIELDAFRNKQFPDDIQVLLESKNDNPNELLWVRIEGIMDKKPNVLICHLLSDSYYNEEFKEDVMVGVEYFEDEDKVKIVGLLKKRES